MLTGWILCRLSFVGDGMTACGLGLAMGLALLAAHEFLGEESLHAMLTFNPGNFFMYVHANLMSHSCVSTQLCFHSALFPLYAQTAAVAGS